MTDDTLGANWHIGDDTPQADFMARIRFMLAGLIGEQILDPDNSRAASSLDEKYFATRLCGLYAQWHGGDGKELYQQCWAQAAAIIQHNADLARELAHKLDRCGELRGKPLHAVLRRVRKYDEQRD